MSNFPSPTEHPRVSVIIPSRDGYRDGAVPRLLESVAKQTFRDYDLHLIKGVSPQGKAINQGAAKSSGDILMILDDDSCLADEKVFQRLINTLEQDPRIGMAGASIQCPPEANTFQHRAAKQFPRFNMPTVSEVTDSDFPCHGCCAIPRRVFNEIGGEREDLIRGLDPDLRVRLRAAGYRVVLVPNAVAYHPLPENWGALIKTFFRNGFGSAYARKFNPESVYETHEHLHASTYKPRTSFAYRLVRFPLRLLAAILHGHFIRFVAYLSYAFGYAWGLLTARPTDLGEGR